MDIFPNIENLGVVEFGRVIVSPSLRGKLTMACLARFASKLICINELGDLLFAQCRPGLVPHYNKLGLRLYQAPLNRLSEGIAVPLVAIVSDYKYHKKVKSIASDIVTKYYGPNKRKPLDISLYNHLFLDKIQKVKFNEENIISTVGNEIFNSDRDFKIFNNISEKELKIILQKSILVDISKETEVVVQGRKESEVYIVIEGLFNVIVNGNIVSTLKKYDIFGEMAFFLDSSNRTATIKSKTEGKILMLDRKCFNRIKEKNYEIAMKLLFNLGKILSHKLDTLSQKI